MHATESWNVTNQAAAQSPVPVVMANSGGGVNSGRSYIMGGRYAFSAVGTFGTNGVELQYLGPDGSTYVSLFGQFNNAGVEADLDIGVLKAAGSKNLDLPPGKYQVVINSGGTGLSIALTRVPVSS